MTWKIFFQTTVYSLLGLLLIISALLLLVPVFSWRAHDYWRRDWIHRHEKKEHISLAHLVREDEFCEPCVRFAQKTIQELYDLIVQGGVIGGCSKLCKALAEEIKIPFVEKTCDIVCSSVGIKAFINFIKKADLNPIYLCELTKFCPVNDYGDAKITNFTVLPPSGPQGRFLLSFRFVSNNGTGTGEIAVAVTTVDGIPVEENVFHKAAQAGAYSGAFKLSAVPDPSCDPSQEQCEKWLPGEYYVKMAICNGICGSKRPHSAVYDTAWTTFTITKKIMTPPWMLD